ncbi:MAG TPA: chemotaxis protein CheA [Anaerolineales bacterium]|nr:chemotaxis protein CheA [Anaerolineales bacterium]
MALSFDLSADEVPVFLAETEEQLQTLDQGLVQLEAGVDSDELLQALFRAAHTLKGGAGMIGHSRLVDLTHALETALDGLRKKNIQVSAEFIDCCLASVDALRLLCDEVTSLEPAEVDLEPRIAELRRFGELPPPTGGSAPCSYLLTARIAAGSIAPAARAFQLMLALQELGEVLDMRPTQAEIESAAPVNKFYARFVSAQPASALYAALNKISEIEDLSLAAADDGADEDGAAEHHLAADLVASRRLVSSVPNETAVAAGKDAAKTPGERLTEAPAIERQTVRASVERLDKLMNLVGELITDRNRLYLLRRELDNRLVGDNQMDDLRETITHVGRITDQLQAEVMGIRMVPIANVFNKFPRVVRDLARRAGKQVDLVMEGEETELDRSVIEYINDPLIHLLRNAVDHGIETPEERRAAGKPERGLARLSARHEQGRIFITLRDDGRGIDLKQVKQKAFEKGLLTERELETLSDDEAVDLIFAAGLSTATRLSDISGRGVGMDIVRTNIEQLHGSISVENWPGAGCEFELVLPLTLAIIPTLLVRINQGMFAIPLVAVMETRRITPQEIHRVQGRPVMRLRDHVLPIIRLTDVFSLPDCENGSGSQNIVVVRQGKSQFGLMVDALIGEQEVVVKSLSVVIGETPGISSAAILGDGRIALILDVQGILRLVSGQASYARKKEVESKNGVRNF